MTAALHSDLEKKTQSLEKDVHPAAFTYSGTIASCHEVGVKGSQRCVYYTLLNYLLLEAFTTVDANLQGRSLIAMWIVM